MADNPISENSIDNPTGNLTENSAENVTEKNSKWHSLGQKVHELELLISSAGVYLSANLPNFLDEIWDNFNYYFSSSVDEISFLSKIIYIILRSSAFTLWLGFICHFSLRAFWIAIIGLANIFPQGVRYEKLSKKFTSSYKDFLVRKILSYEQLISLIDKMSSGVLVIVFFLIIVFLATVVMYGGIMLMLFLLMLLVPDYIFKNYSYLFFILSFVICFIVPIKKTIVILITKRGDERKNELKYISQTATLFGDMIYHITLVLKTNLPKSGFYFVIFCIVALSAVFGVFLFNSKEKKTIIATSTVNLDMYENTRNGKKFVTKMCLNSDIIKEKYIKIFIANPRELKQHTTHFEAFSVENMEREERRKQKKIFELAQWRNFFKIYINEVPQEYELNFETHLQTNTGGFVVYLPLSEPKIGKNILSIKIPSSNTKIATEINWSEAPFWYFP